MKRLADQSLYEILEVPADASAEELQAAYERARATYGPGSLVTYTLMEPDEAAMLEARIEDARTTLLDPEKRARYDEALREPQEARALASGGSGPAVSAPPPVAPAAPDLPPPLPEPAGPPPAILLGAPIELAELAELDEPAEEPPPAPRPAPILLQHEISQDAVPTATATAAAIATATATATPTTTPTATSAATSTPPSIAHAAAAPLPAPPLPDAWTGDALRQVRESRGLSVTQISEKTKVTRHHIENIEADRFASLPAQVYLRGILLAIARELRLDGQKVARSYLERIGASQVSAAAAPKVR